MSKVKPQALSEAIQRELTIYHEGVKDRINEAGDKASKKLLKMAKAGAPVASGSLKRNLAVKTETSWGTGMNTYILHAKAPDHRILHLVVHGHATRNGGRTKSNPFLKNALDAVLPEYEKAVEEALKK